MNDNERDTSANSSGARDKWLLDNSVELRAFDSGLPGHDVTVRCVARGTGSVSDGGLPGVVVKCVRIGGLEGSRVIVVRWLAELVKGSGNGGRGRMVREGKLGVYHVNCVGHYEAHVNEDGTIVPAEDGSSNDGGYSGTLMVLVGSKLVEFAGVAKAHESVRGGKFATDMRRAYEAQLR